MINHCSRCNYVVHVVYNVRWARSFSEDFSEAWLCPNCLKEVEGEK